MRGRSLPGWARGVTVPAFDVAITTSAKTDEQGFALLRGFGMPFAADGREQQT